MHFVPAEEMVRQRAQSYMGAGIKPLDALHLASAVESGAHYFCTCDDKLLKRSKSVDTGSTRVVTPLELIKETE